MPAPTGTTVRTRLRLSDRDVVVLTEIGALLGSLAARDLAVRSRQGTVPGAGAWADRKRALTVSSSARWAGSITRATNDQWALARRGQAAEMGWLRSETARIAARLARPLGAKAEKRTALPRGYADRTEWHAKARRLEALRTRLASLEADWASGRVHVVRGGRRLACLRHRLDEAGLSREAQKQRWQAARMFLSADGESGKRFGNETIRVTDGGHVSIRLPSALAHLANAPHGRYALAQTVAFGHRAEEWRDRITADRAVAYRIHYDVTRGRWYLTAAWQRAVAPALTLPVALARGVVAIDMNEDHLAAWYVDVHGNPVGEPRRFPYDLSGGASHRDAQIRHALTQLLHFTRRRGAAAIAVEDLDFTDAGTRENHGRAKRFRRLLSRFPTARLRTRLVAMAAEQNIAVVAVDPAYTSQWGAQHWQKPLTTRTRPTTRHDAAALAIGRRALGHPIRRRKAPPRTHRSDGFGHRRAPSGVEHADSPRSLRPRAARIQSAVRKGRGEVPHAVRPPARPGGSEHGVFPLGP
ncbi:IS200/IS605 family accessory protein TnpB-related protein [Streptomyces sp. NPDC127079]|uniref:IS200/IS605 family accessory protein TnpB-related protein n=1 Tax=Streptomyces sp. NPDC127079 TaxID=3347132 RepID=UPI0036648746